jgi:hypothetical protein
MRTLPDRRSPTTPDRAHDMLDRSLRSLRLPGRLPTCRTRLLIPVTEIASVFAECAQRRDAQSSAGGRATGQDR